MYFLALSAFFVCFASLGYVTVSLLFPGTSVLKEQLGFYEAQWQSVHGTRVAEKREGRRLSQALDFTAVLAARRGAAELIDERLQRAGLEIRPEDFIGLHLLATVGLALVGYWFGGLVGLLMLAAIAALLPLVYLDYACSRRQKLFHEQLPGALQMVAASLKAGYSFLQAVDMIVQETEPPMSVEFGRVLTDARLGLPVEQALDKMAERVRSTNFTWTVMAVRIQREVGGNLAEVLETLAGTIRERDQVERQIQVLTAEGRLSALILFCLPFFLAVVLYLVNPGYVSLLFTTFSGLAMLALALMLMGAGAVWLRQIIRIEV